nr:uncharacterized protein LOC112011173 [Quercus suber]
MEENFPTFEIEHALRNENRFVDALAALGSQIMFEGDNIGVELSKREESIIEMLKERFQEEHCEGDWWIPIREALMEEEDAVELKILKDYALVRGELYRKMPGGVLSRCVGQEEDHRKLKEVHDKTCGSCGEVSLYRRLQRAGFYRPNMGKDADQAQTQCGNCQLMADREESYTVFINEDWRSPFDGEPLRCLGLEAAREMWAEAVPLRKATGGAVENFIKENIIVRFGVPHKVINDNDTPFVNSDVRKMREFYQVKHHRSSLYYPQGNGQIEATNKTLIKIISKMSQECTGEWAMHLPDALWAYRSSPKSATGFSPFSLVYGTEVVSPAEIMTPSLRVMQMQEKEKEEEVFVAERCEDLKDLMKKEKRPKNAAVDTAKND